MKDWTADHPKAKLMARKRGQILAAAREAFLRMGYEGTSMETIAAAAGVSIMTLYRHAESKGDLFAAVIAGACDPNDEAEQAEFARLLQKPTFELLTEVGILVQNRLTDPNTVALMRVVMAEVERFPELGEKAYAGFVGHLDGMMIEVFAMRPEFAGMDRPTRERLSSRFIDQLLGSDMYRVLLGLKGLTSPEKKRRAEQASRDALEAATDGNGARATE
jgi:TetR/AcrR family transcriptional regulator, mexJK operon transcriptional repressor